MSANDLISKGFGGYAGWNDTEADADFAKTGGAGKKTTGGGSVSLDVPSIAAYTEQAYAPADEALKSYVMALRGSKNPLDVYNELEASAGLPEMRKTAGTLREQIGSLEDTIRRVEGNVASTTQNSYVTQGQRAGMIEARQRPLIQDLSTISTGLGRIEQGISAASEGIGTKTNLFMQGQEQSLKPYEVQVSALQDRAARMVSGFTADSQNKLQTLLAQWNRNNELDDKQTEQAFQLLTAETSYNNEIKKLQEQQKIDLETYQKKKNIDRSSSNTNTNTPNSNLNLYYGGSSSPTTISDLWGSG